MNTKRTKRIALLFAAALIFAAQAFAQDFPAYLTMDGTMITGCDKASLPENLVIPDGVTEIGYDAFDGCISLATVSIPASVTKIGTNAFLGCDNIKTVQYRGMLAQWCQIDNDRDLVANAKAITMSDIVDLKAVTTLAIPNGVAKIGGNTFYGCKSLTSVSIPASVTEIGSVSNAFSKCDNIKTVQYEGTLAQWWQMDNDSYLVANAKTITMSDIVDLKAMTTLAIPNGVAKIGRAAFCGCKSLASVTIPASVTEIGGGAFWGCDNIKTVQYRGTLAQWCQIDNDGQLVANTKIITMSDIVDLKAMTALTIPDGVTKIGWGAFEGCASLATVSIPASVTEIGWGTFRNCDNIKTVQYRGTFAQWCQIDNDDNLVWKAETITMSDIVDLKAMTALAIPDGVAKIGWCAFYNCKSLASVTIPASMTEIGFSAFRNCDNIKTVQYKGTLAQWCQIDNDDNLVWKAETITMSDIVDLKAVTALIIPDGMTKIGRAAFYGCNSLASVTIPASVKEIGFGAFDGCGSLKEVKYLGTNAQWQAFNVSLYPGAVVHCADGDYVKE